ncbi:MAG: SgcJ/EcaC family oxidoreductase [Candidatus Aminicenantes bacterium]|jgi:uncharacterized protein (TIGR02246 family)
MKKLFVVIPLVFLFCLTFGCQQAEEVVEDVAEAAIDMVKVRQEIEAANAKFGEAVRAGDAAMLASYYTEDATLLPPNSEMIKGRAAVEAYWAGGFQMGIKDVLLTTVDVMGMGDLVCEIGTAKVSLQPEEMDAMEDMAKYLVVWKKGDDGMWRLHVDIWNSSLPVE